MGKEQITEQGSYMPSEQSFESELDKSFEDIFDPEEIRVIQEQINRKFQSDSDLSNELDSRIHNAVPQKRAQRIPLSVSVPSAFLLIFSMILLFEPASTSGETVFSLLFPSVARDSNNSESVNLTQVARKIPDAQSQQRFGVILRKIAQERALDYFTEVQEILGEQSEEGGNQLEEQIEAIQEAIAVATEEINTFQPDDITDVETGSTAIHPPSPILASFDALRREQDQYEGLLDQYAVLTAQVRNAVARGNISIIENRLSNLQVYIDTLSASNSRSIELIIESGNAYILTVQEVIVSLRSRTQVNQEQASISQEYINLLEDAQQEYLTLGRRIHNAITSGNTSLLTNSLESFEEYINSLSINEGEGIASLIANGQNLIANGRRHLEIINQLDDLNNEITILQNNLSQARQSLAELQASQEGQNVVSVTNLQSQNQQIINLNQQITTLESQIAILTNQARTYQVSGRLCENDLYACKRSVTR